ncbi:GHKL domain-containing protein [Bacillus sp. CGMCC 1.16541]|uniref:sensor histidine kinase n=1 Tax=Bacillus sp. CGMCC 1.16541 TaxID=2185143 RepID=UPI000D725DB2|nr:GHKL domain-containing protein [Bacillus sp. CGMCC 1.16541]
MNKYQLSLSIILLFIVFVQPCSIVVKVVFSLFLLVESYVSQKRATPLSWHVVVLHGLLLIAMVLSSSWLVTGVLLVSLYIVEWLRFFLMKQVDMKVKAWNEAFSELAATDELFRSVRAERHDYMKHISTVHYLVETNQIEEAKSYLQAYVGAVGDVSSYIKGEAAHVASVLHRVTREAKQENITLSLQCMVPLSALPLQPIDQVNLLMNLLENSVDAAKQSEQKEITIKTSTHGGIYMMEVINSTPPLSHERQEHLFSQFQITEKGGHHEGLGTWIIKETVNNYRGHLDYAYKPPYLGIKIKVPIVTNS